jgi:hypothetical protein
MGHFVITVASYPARMIATDKDTGKVVWETNLADGQADLQLTAAPLAVKDKIVLGAAGGDRGAAITGLKRIACSCGLPRVRPRNNRYREQQWIALRRRARLREGSGQALDTPGFPVKRSRAARRRKPVGSRYDRCARRPNHCSTMGASP